MHTSLSLLERVFPQLSTLNGMASGGILAFLLMALLVILLAISIRRHSLLYYGSKLTHGAAPLLLILFYLPLIATGNPGIFFTMLLVLLTYEMLLNGYGRPARPYRTFNVGALVALLALIHPAWLLTLPLVLYRLYRIEHLDKRSIASLLLGLTSIIWVAVLLMVQPSIIGLQSFAQQHLHPLLEPQLPHHDINSVYIAQAVLLGALTIYYYSFRNRALERHRFFAACHISFAWCAYLLQLLYNEDGTHLSFQAATLYFSVVLLQLFYRTTREKLWVTLVSALALATLITLIASTARVYLNA